MKILNTLKHDFEVSLLGSAKALAPNCTWSRLVRDILVTDL